MSDRERTARAPAIGRREALVAGGARCPLAAGLALSPARLQAAQEHVHQGSGEGRGRGSPRAPKFFTAHEWATVRVLADAVIPADERSGSATDALVPEFIDFILDDPLAEPRERESLQTAGAGRPRLARPRVPRAVREGLRRVRPRTSGRAVLDDIAWPEKARDEMGPGAAFFSLFRDLVASGFWSSRMGVEDLRYTGNTFVAEWKGCPPEVLAKIGVTDRTEGA